MTDVLEELAGDVLARLRGVGDQAVSALQRARLLETVRHQSWAEIDRRVDATVGLAGDRASTRGEERQQRTHQ